MFFRNVSEVLPDSTASHPRRLPLSFESLRRDGAANSELRCEIGLMVASIDPCGFTSPVCIARAIN
jgi:hypothetical protein